MMAEDNESSSDKCESDSGKPEKMFTLKKWNAVAMWSWDVECDICAICRVQVMDACLRCQAENKREVLGRQDCVVVWGECNHSFHHCCMSLWVKQNNRCPLCQQEWSIQRMGNWRNVNTIEMNQENPKLAKMNVLEPPDHLLALKVMRLTRPTLVSPQIIMSEAKDLPQNIFYQILENDATSVAGSETIAAGQFMLLPQSFGNIYLGETFSSYICVHNCTAQPIDGVTVKADLQSNTTRISLPLHEKKSIPATLHPDDTLDDVIHHEVKEIGTHILVCEVHYTTPAGLSQSFRKFFKFQVLKPLDVKTKFYNAETDEVYLEAQIQNITAGPICLEKVELDSSEHYTVSALNTLANGESVFTAKNMLQPKNSCQFLYCIKPIPEITKDISALKAANNIGKLDIVWRSNLGERGRLQTSQLQRVPIEYNDLRLIVTQASNIVRIGEPFTFICRVTNTCDRPMELTAKLDTKPRFGCDYTGSAEFDLGTIDPGRHKEFPLTVCPAKLGLIKVTNLLLTNTFLKRTYEFDDFVQVFVVDSDYFESDTFQMNKFVRYDVAQTV